MGTLVNLLNAQPKLYDGPTRDMDPNFGETYFDGTRDQGYGGYQYDGRWKPIAQAIINRYQLTARSRVLDLGCAKGFFMADLLELCPGISVSGIEVSEYAVMHTLPQVKSWTTLGTCENLRQFADRSFDFVAAMNTLHFLSPEGAEKGIREIQRVSKKNAFIQVDAFTDAVGRERLLAWAPIIKTIFSVDQWLALFEKVGYNGDYFWTFVRPLTPEKFQASDKTAH